MDASKIEPSIYRYILHHTKKSQLFLILLTLVSMPFVYAALEVPKLIINNALGNEGIPQDIFGIPLDQISYLLVLCFSFLSLVLINGGLKYVNNLYRGILGEKMLRQFRIELFSRILRFPRSHFKKVSQAEIIPMVTAETEPLGGFIGDAFALPVFQGGLLVTYLFFIFNQDPLLGIAAIALYPFQIWLIPKLQKKVNTLSRERVMQVRKFSDKVGESISGISDIRVNGTTQHEIFRAFHRLSSIYRIRHQIFRKKFLIKFLNNFIGQVTPFFFYSIGGYFVIKGELSLGALVAVLAAYKDLAPPWKELLKFYQISEDVRVKYSQIIEQFQPENMLPSATEQPSNDEEFDGVGDIQGIGIAYDEDVNQRSLEEANFLISQGEHIAICGDKDSDLGNLMQLIARLLKPTVGKVLMSGQDTSSMSESVLSRHIGYADQHSHIFNGTIRENLLYGLAHLSAQGALESYDEQQTDNVMKEIKWENIMDDNHSLLKFGFDSIQAFKNHEIQTLDLCSLKDDVYDFGLRGNVQDNMGGKLLDDILKARHRIKTLLKEDRYQGLVDVLEADRYNERLSMAENFFFGVPIKGTDDLGYLISHPVVVEVMETMGLKEVFVRIGYQVASIMSDLLAEIPDGSPVFQQFDFISIEEVPEIKSLSLIPNDFSVSDLDDSQTNRFIELSFKLITAKHRLGLITDETRGTVVMAHKLLKQKLGMSNNLIDFYHPERLASHLSIEDNMLFGRIVSGHANARKKVGELIFEVAQSMNLVEQIVEVGLNYRVGVGGSRLASAQRQKLTLARALIKKPDLLVVNGATSQLDTNVERRLYLNILHRMKGNTVVWSRNRHDDIDGFD
ncbi:MAG: ATP-binding cassette domain-containing protein [Gammaproteobacteria bacterium]|nr:ATP-binding cassette domain-containing protein [Gammaproteobacteria bacterium]